MAFVLLGNIIINSLTMKKLILIAICFVGLSSCDKPAKMAGNNIKEEKPAVGSEKDSHGCIATAGQTWSELKKDCIQIFNEGLRLNPVEVQKNNSVISIFVLLNDDRSKLELFLPDNTIMLTKSDQGIYQNDNYEYDSEKSVLYVNGIKKYEGNVE